MSDWYRNKLAQVRGSTSAPSYPATRYEPDPRRSVAPPGVNGYQQFPQQPQQQGPLQVTMDNLWQVMHLWKGGQAHKVDRDPCPQCGSVNYYSRHTGKRGPPPAPHCFSCGYNDGLFSQGDATTWGATGV